MTSSSRSTRSNERFGSPAQISLEALLLWAAMAGALAVFLPIVLVNVDAHTLMVQSRDLSARTQSLQEQLDALSFASPGSQFLFRVPPFEGLEIQFEATGMDFLLHSPHLSQPKHWHITSPLPLQGNLSIAPGDDILFFREVDGILIR